MSVRDYKINDMVFFAIGYMLLSIVFLIVTTNFISIWLGINVGLAMIPLLLITILYKRLESKEFSFDWVSIILMIAFVFFFPNTFYVVTDLIHIDQSQFYNDSTVGFLKSIEGYTFIFHVVLTLAIGSYAGIKSLLRFNEIFIQKDLLKGTRVALFSALVLLSSVGIYIGRFLRFFSWDILNPFKLLNEFYLSLDFFFVLFVGLFTVIQVTIYYGYRLLYEKEPFN